MAARIPRPGDQQVGEIRNIRVEDFLNDKLQNSTDLANIDTLLEGVQAQQVLLQQQVSFIDQADGLRED